MDRLKLARECVEVEKAGESVRDFLRQRGCISPWGTWYRLQKEELGRSRSEITDGKGKDMKRVRITDIQKAEAVKIAMAGGDPRNYLRDCGSKAPDIMWQKIRDKLRAEDPEAYAKLPARIPRAKRSLPKGFVPIDVYKPKKKKVEIKDKLPEEARNMESQGKKTITVKATAAEGMAGTWRKSGDMIALDIYRDNVRKSECEMTPKEWEAAAAELPEVLRLFGVEA